MRYSHSSLVVLVLLGALPAAFMLQGAEDAPAPPPPADAADTAAPPDPPEPPADPPADGDTKPADAASDDAGDSGLPEEYQKIIVNTPRFTVTFDGVTTPTLRRRPGNSNSTSFQYRQRTIRPQGEPIPILDLKPEQMQELLRSLPDHRHLDHQYDGVYRPSQQAHWIVKPKMTSEPDATLVRPVNEAAEDEGPKALDRGWIVPPGRR